MSDGAAEAGQPATARAPLPPNAVLRYRLSPADALAWERRNPVEKKRKRGVMAGAVFAGILLLSVTSRHLPAWLSNLHSNALAVAILFLPLALALAIQSAETRRRARRAVADEVEATLEVWDRRLVETRADRTEPVVLGAQALRDVIETPDHIFLQSRGATIILPARAFADAKAKDAFAGHWEAMVG